MEAPDFMSGVISCHSGAGRNPFCFDLSIVDILLLPQRAQRSQRKKIIMYPFSVWTFAFFEGGN
jgi:hypothetical protein